MQLLKEVAPSVRRVGFMATPKSSPYRYFLQAAQASASELGIEMIPSPVESVTDIENTIEGLAGTHDAGLVLLPEPFAMAFNDLIIDLTIRNNLPLMCNNRYSVRSGALMSYDTSRVEISRLSADYVDRILRGAKPADLPVQAPTRFELQINLKTAKAIGLTVPPALLLAANEVIE